MGSTTLISIYIAWRSRNSELKKTEASALEAIDSIYTKALENGATGGKISGAGGGGFMFFYCPAVTKIKVAKAIETLGGNVQAFKFTQQGLVTWKI